MKMKTLDFVDLLCNIRDANSIDEINLIYGSFEDPEKIEVDGHYIRLYGLVPGSDDSYLLIYEVFATTLPNLDTVKEVVLDNFISDKAYKIDKFKEDKSWSILSIVNSL